MLKRIQQHMNAIEIARLTLSLSTRARACDTGADALLVGAMQPLFRLRSRAADDGRHERAAKKWHPHANATAAQAYDHRGSRQDRQVRVIMRMRSCASTHSHAAGTHAMRVDCPVIGSQCRCPLSLQECTLTQACALRIRRSFTQSHAGRGVNAPAIWERDLRVGELSYSSTTPPLPYPCSAPSDFMRVFYR